MATFKVTNDTSTGTFKAITAATLELAAAQYAYLYCLPTDADDPDRDTIYVIADDDPAHMAAFHYGMDADHVTTYR